MPLENFGEKVSFIWSVADLLRCVRLKPYNLDDRVLLDVQQIVPLPEAEDYQVRVREKARRERGSRNDPRDMTRVTVHLGDEVIKHLPKRQALHKVVCYLANAGAPMDRMRGMMPGQARVDVVDGEVGSEEFAEAANRARLESGRPLLDPGWSFCSEAELIHQNGRTYSITKRWGRKCVETMQAVVDAFPEHGVSFELEG